MIPWFWQLYLRFAEQRLRRAQRRHNENLRLWSEVGQSSPEFCYRDQSLAKTGGVLVKAGQRAAAVRERLGLSETKIKIIQPAKTTRERIDAIRERDDHLAEEEKPVCGLGETATKDALTRVAAINRSPDHLPRSQKRVKKIE